MMEKAEKIFSKIKEYDEKQEQNGPFFGIKGKAVLLF